MADILFALPIGIFLYASSGLMETKEQRKYPVEFDGPTRDADVFDIKIPQGYQVDELPLPTEADYSFASYHSKTAVNGNATLASSRSRN